MAPLASDTSPCGNKAHRTMSVWPGGGSMVCEPRFADPTLFPCSASAGRTNRASSCTGSLVGASSRLKSLARSSQAFEKSMTIEDFKADSTAGPKAPQRQVDAGVTRGRCIRCGIKTHTTSVFSCRPLTSSDVYKGRCIRCSPELVPCSVRNEWEIQNAALLVQDEVGSVSSHPEDVRCFSGMDNPGRQSNLGASLNDLVEAIEDGGSGIIDDDDDENLPERTKRSGNRCTSCGIRTHKSILGKRFPVTTPTVFEGHCIKCSPTDVPLGVLQKWQRKSLGEHAKNIPDTVDFVLDMENPCIPSAGVKAAPSSGKSRRSLRRSRNSKRNSTLTTEAELTDKLLMERIAASILADTRLDRTSLNELITKPEPKKPTGDEKKQDFLPPTSVVGVPVAKVVKSGSASDNDSEILHAHVALPCNVHATSESSNMDTSESFSCTDTSDSSYESDVVYASQVEPLAARKGYCQQCGEVKTHRTLPYSIVRIPITNNQCHKGCCLSCHPEQKPTIETSSGSRRASLTKRFRQRVNRAVSTPKNDRTTASEIV